MSQKQWNQIGKRTLIGVGNHVNKQKNRFENEITFIAMKIENMWDIDRKTDTHSSTYSVPVGINAFLYTVKQSLRVFFCIIFAINWTLNG